MKLIQLSIKPMFLRFAIDGPDLTSEEMEKIHKENLVNRSIQLIQNHERARQARLYFNELRQLAKTRKELAGVQKPEEQPDSTVQNDAAIIMQKIWKGFADRQYLAKREKERRFLIGRYIKNSHTVAL